MECGTLFDWIDDDDVPDFFRVDDISGAVSSDGVTTPADSPHDVTAAATSPHDVTAAASPHGVTAAASHDVTAAATTHDVTTADSPHDVTAADSPHDVTTADSPHDVTAADSPHDFTTATPGYFSLSERSASPQEVSDCRGNIDTQSSTSDQGSASPDTVSFTPDSSSNDSGVSCSMTSHIGSTQTDHLTVQKHDLLLQAVQETLLNDGIAPGDGRGQSVVCEAPVVACRTNKKLLHSELYAMETIPPPTPGVFSSTADAENSGCVDDLIGHDVLDGNLNALVQNIDPNLFMRKPISVQDVDSALAPCSDDPALCRERNALPDLLEQCVEMSEVFSTDVPTSSQLQQVSQPHSSQASVSVPISSSNAASRSSPAESPLEPWIRHPSTHVSSATTPQVIYSKAQLKRLAAARRPPPVVRGAAGSGTSRRGRVVKNCDGTSSRRRQKSVNVNSVPALRAQSFPVVSPQSFQVLMPVCINGQVMFVKTVTPIVTNRTAKN